MEHKKCNTIHKARNLKHEMLHAPCSMRRGSRGFTLVETLVALTIFTTSLLGLMVIASQGISGTNGTKSSLTAGYLAEEGIEMVRQVRDSQAIAATSGGNTDWFSPLLNDVNNSPWTLQPCSGSCKIYYDHNGGSGVLKVQACGGQCSELYYDSTSGHGYYNYSLPGNTGLVRTITIKPVSDHEATVTSTVSWHQGITQKSVTLTENIFGWQ